MGIMFVRIRGRWCQRRAISAQFPVDAPFLDVFQNLPMRIQTKPNKTKQSNYAE